MRPKRGVCSRNPKGGALIFSETLVKTAGQRSEWGPRFQVQRSKAGRLEYLGMFEEWRKGRMRVGLSVVLAGTRSRESLQV